MSETGTSYNRGVVRPVQCLRAGWRLVKDDYWLFLGITVVGVLIANAAPLGLLMGPATCGIYISLLRRMRGRQVGFNDLLRGFDYFGPSLVATLIMLVPAVLLMVPFYLGFFAAFFTLLPVGQNTPPDPSALLTFFLVLSLLVLALVVASVLVGALFLFTFPLMVDRGMQPLAAIRTSMAAVRANFWGVLGLMLLQTALSFVGLLLCYVGAFLELPILFASVAVAYRQVFPEAPAPEELLSEEAGPAELAQPASPAGPPDEGIREGPPQGIQEGPPR